MDLTVEIDSTKSLRFNTRHLHSLYMTKNQLNFLFDFVTVSVFDREFTKVFFLFLFVNVQSQAFIGLKRRSFTELNSMNIASNFKIFDEKEFGTVDSFSINHLNLLCMQTSSHSPIKLFQWFAPTLSDAKKYVAVKIFVNLIR